MAGFEYSPSKWVPFRDEEVLERVRRVTRQEIERHPNPEFRIRVIKDADVEFGFVTDIVRRIKEAADRRRRLVMILPNPWPAYKHVAGLVNAVGLDCRHVHAFAMDEYASEDGVIAPPDWPYGFTHAMMKYFYRELDERLRPPERQFVGFTNANLSDYAKMIEDLGGADIVYCGPGWTGHLAFIEPDAPEFRADLDEWKRMGPRIVTLSPFTLAQNSLHGSFGMSGDLARVPPKAATIGPAQVIAAKHRRQTHAITVHGTSTSWQRLTTRLALHGPVTPLVPESICQTLRTDVFVSETLARDIRPDWDKGY